MASCLRLHLLGTAVMNRHSVLRGAQVCAGLVAAPLAWTVCMQLSQILPYVDCASRGHSTAITAACAVAVALVAAWLSWRGSGRTSPEDGQPVRWVASVAGLSALVIGFALALQLLASLMLNACER
jgi:hypothetical protein